MHNGFCWYPVCGCVDSLSLAIYQPGTTAPSSGYMNQPSFRETLCAICLFQICLKGKVHIFKYLNIQACRMDKKPDTLDLPSLGKRCLPQPLTDRY